MEFDMKVTSGKTNPLSLAPVDIFFSSHTLVNLSATMAVR